MNYGDIVYVRTATGTILEKRVVTTITNQVFVCSEDEWQNAIKEHRRPHSIPYYIDDILEYTRSREAVEEEKSEEE